MLQLLAICAMGDVYIENRRGPNTDPRGTPDVQVVTPDEACSMAQSDDLCAVGKV